MYYTHSDAGVKIGAGPFTQYFMGQLHLENYHAEVGKSVTQIMRLWHTGILRKNELDMIENDLSSNSGFAGFGVIIPPFEPHFQLKSLLNTHCFNHVIMTFIIFIPRGDQSFQF